MHAKPAGCVRGGPHLEGGVAQDLLQALLCDRVALDDVLQQNVQYLCLLACSAAGMQHTAINDM